MTMAERLRALVGGPVSAVLVLLMLAGCLFLWVGVPLGWLWVGSQVQGSASLGTALLVTMVGVLVSVIAVAAILSRLNRMHAALRESRNRPTSRYGALEPMLVTSAGIAVVLFAIWFFGFAGASPLPLNIGY
jgi:uncharacterized membrane protein YbhN (UPF0104 family)